MEGTLSRWRCACGETLWEECRFNGLYHCPVFHVGPRALAAGSGLTRCPHCDRPLYPESVRDPNLQKASSHLRAAVGRYVAGAGASLAPHILADSGIDQ